MAIRKKTGDKKTTGRGSSTPLISPKGWPTKTHPSPWPSTPSLGGPNGQGFGGTVGFGSNGSVASYRNITEDDTRNGAVSRGLESILQGGNFADNLARFLDGHKFAGEEWALFYESLLQYMMTNDQRVYDRQLTLDQREYDWNMLQDQRIYNNPTNELARLMGAGISRDAAIQLLSSARSGAGSGVSGGSPVTQQPTSPGQVSGTPGTLASNIAFNTIGAVCDLVNMGFSASQSYAQTQFIKNQNYLTEQQIGAYNDASKAFNIISASGTEINEKTFGSVNDTIKTIQTLADSGNEAAAAFISEGGHKRLRLSSPYSSQFLNSLYRNERDSKDYNTSFEAEIRRQNAQAYLNEVNADKILTEIPLIEAQINEVVASTEYTQAQTGLVEFSKKVMTEQANELKARANLLTKQGKTEEARYYNVLADTKLKKAQSYQANATGTSISLENQLQSAWMNATKDGKTGLEIFTDQRITSLQSLAKETTQAANDEIWLKRVKAYGAELENMQSLYVLERLYNTGALTEYNQADSNTKSLLATARVFEKNGVFEYVNALVNASTGNQLNSPYFSTKAPVKEAVDLFDR